MLVNVTVAVVAVLLDVAVEVTAAFISWAEQTARPQASANKTNEVLMLMAEQFWVCNLLTLQSGIAKQRRIEKVQLQRRRAVDCGFNCSELELVGQGEERLLRTR